MFPAVSRLLCRSSALLLAALAACASTPPTVDPLPDPVQSSEPPITGYLSADEVPDSLALSPPPPEAGSLWAALDESIADAAIALRGSARFAQAREDADLGLSAFACTLGVEIDAQNTPALHRLLQRVRRDTSAATRAAKRQYQRERPFMRNGQPTCTPEYEDSLRSNGSYPSGHTTSGWARGLILAQIAPDRASALLLRARQYGYSRLVCNVHWYSDVLQGQMLAAATVANLNATAEFVRDLAQARVELDRVRARALPLERDCAAEAAALETSISGVR